MLRRRLTENKADGSDPFQNPNLPAARNPLGGPEDPDQDQEEEGNEEVGRRSPTGTAACRRSVTCWFWVSPVQVWAGLTYGSFQGDIPWDDREFRLYLLSGVAFWTAATYYFFLRDGGREVTWKDFVNSYLSKGVVRNSPGWLAMERYLQASDWCVSPSGGPFGGGQQALREGVVLPGEDAAGRGGYRWTQVSGSVGMETDSASCASTCSSTSGSTSEAWTPSRGTWRRLRASWASRARTACQWSTQPRATGNREPPRPGRRF